MATRVALLLSGCGVFDGSEIHESVLAMLALDNAGAEITCCAPDVPQAEVINHITQEPSGEQRNVLVESARIARGKIRDLAGIRAQEFDALVMPGGYGAAKNLCTYAAEGRNARIHPEVERVLDEFITQRKPVGAICISPVLLARYLKDHDEIKASLTIGTDEATLGDIEAFGSRHVACTVKEFVVDRDHLLVTTPAYMLGTGPAEVFVGIEKLVKAVLEMCENH